MDTQFLTSLFLLRTASPRSVAPRLVLPLPCHFSVICTEYLAFLHILVETCPANRLQEFDFSVPLVLALFVSNLIFNCWAVSPTYCVKQFEHELKYQERLKGSNLWQQKTLPLFSVSFLTSNFLFSGMSYHKCHCRWSIKHARPSFGQQDKKINGK